VALSHLAAMSGLVGVGLPAAPELLVEHYEEIVLVHVVQVGRFDCVRMQVASPCVTVHAFRTWPSSMQGDTGGCSRQSR